MLLKMAFCEQMMNTNIFFSGFIIRLQKMQQFYMPRQTVHVYTVLIITYKTYHDSNVSLVFSAS